MFIDSEAVADLLPAESNHNADAVAAVDEMLSFMRAQRAVADVDLEVLSDEGRA
ncbi:MAG: hypothetical protein PHV02_03375 [Rhodocyclaceae bacterium]|nr:hypothetical protein [Rhodocyclaceae bacterium]